MKHKMSYIFGFFISLDGIIKKLWIIQLFLGLYIKLLLNVENILFYNFFLTNISIWRGVEWFDWLQNIVFRARKHNTCVTCLLVNCHWFFRFRIFVITTRKFSLTCHNGLPGIFMFFFVCRINSQKISKRMWFGLF